MLVVASLGHVSIIRRILGLACTLTSEFDWSLTWGDWQLLMASRVKVERARGLCLGLGIVKIVKRPCSDIFIVLIFSAQVV
jgi:hypothetical protein